MHFSHGDEGSGKTGITRWLSTLTQSNPPPPDAMDSNAEESRMPEQNGQQYRINGYEKDTRGTGMQEPPRHLGTSFNMKKGAGGDTSAESRKPFGLPPSHSSVLEEEKNSRIYPPKAVDQSSSLNPAGSYVRRPRHKTRKNRYEPIADQNLSQRLASSTKRKKQASNPKKAQPKSKRKRLDDDFRANNVREGRLTLDPSFEMGLFRHGKTSSPIQRSGIPDLSFSEMKFLSRDSEREFGTAHTRENANTAISDPTQSTKVSPYFGAQQANVNPPQRSNLRLSDSSLLADAREEGCSSKTGGKGQRSMLPGGQGKCPIQWYAVANERDVESRVEPSNQSTSCYTWSGTNSEPPTKRSNHNNLHVRQQSCGGLSPPIPVPDNRLHNSLPASKARKLTASNDPEYSLETESKVNRMVFRNAYIPRSEQLEGLHLNGLYSFEDLVELGRTASLPVQDSQDIQSSQGRQTFDCQKTSEGTSKRIEERLNPSRCYEISSLCGKTDDARGNGNLASPGQRYSVDEYRHNAGELNEKGALDHSVQDLEAPPYEYACKGKGDPPEYPIQGDALARLHDFRVHRGSGAPDRIDSHSGDITDSAGIVERYKPRLHLYQPVCSQRASTPLVAPFTDDRLQSLSPNSGQFRWSERQISRAGVQAAPRSIDFSVPDTLPFQFWRPNKLY